MASLTIRLFGPMLVLVDGEPLPRLRSRKALWLLALLSLRANRAVSREWLASTLWPDADLSVAFNNLRPVISEMRRSLGVHAERLQAVDRNTIRFDAEGVDLDVRRFDEAIRRGEWEAATALYGGALLEDCTEEWAPQERAARETDCLRALQAVGEAAHGRGDFEGAIAGFSRAAAMDAWRDAPRRGLMAALAAKGDVNAALQTYRDFAHLLSAEAGTAPDAQTTELYGRLRSEAKRSARRAEGGRPPEAERSATAVRLPHALTPMVGREDERLDLAARLRSSRLVTLLGPGGIGKTRLATETAHDLVGEYPDGVWFVALEGATDDRMVVQELAATLEIAEEAGRSTLQTVRRALGDKRVLIVLDNCEHVIAASADLAASLLRDCGGVRILATSREPLGVTGERVWPVPPLAVPSPEGLPEGRTTLLRVMQGYEGVRLFVERAQGVRPDFEITPENAGAVAAICARMEGVPLALELAAARLRGLSPEGVAERLGDSLRLLGGARGTPAKRQQTLRATIDWSHSLLNEDERTLLRRLAAFANGWTREAAAAIGGEDAAEGLASLVDKSLVVFDERADRYRFLETVRQYAAERLELAGERAEIAARFRTWAVALAARSEQAFDGPTQAEWARRLDAEGDNLRAALDLCDDAPEDGLAMVGALARYWYFRNRFAEGRARLDQALDRPLPRPEASASKARALSGAGMLAYAQKDLDAATRHYEACIAICRELDDARGVARATCNLGNLAFYRRETAQAITYYEESLAVQKSLGDRRNAALLVSNLGMAYEALGEYAKARDLCAEALDLFREVGDARSVVWMLKQRGEIARLMGDFGEARGFLEEALALFREGGDENGVAETLVQLAYVVAELGGGSGALALLEEAAELYRGLGNAMGEVAVEAARGGEFLRREAFASAQASFEKVLAHEDDPRHAAACVEARTGLGRIALAQGRWDEADARLRAAHRSFVEHGDRRGAAGVLEELAALSLAQGDAEAAARGLGTAESLQETLGTPLPDSARAERATAIAEIRERLGDAAFGEAWARGRTADWREVASPSRA